MNVYDDDLEVYFETAKTTVSESVSIANVRARLSGKVEHAIFVPVDVSSSATLIPYNPDPAFVQSLLESNAHYNIPYDADINANPMYLLGPEYVLPYPVPNRGPGFRTFLYFAPNTDTTTFAIKVFNDAVVETDEFITLTMLPEYYGHASIRNGSQQVQVKIADDDAAKRIIVVSVPSYGIVEGSGTMDLTFSRGDNLPGSTIAYLSPSSSLNVGKAR